MMSGLPKQNSSWLLIVAVLVFIATITTGIALAQCPSVEQIQKNMKTITPQKIEVLKVSASGIPGFCQVVVLLKGRQRIIYTDPTGTYLFLGQIIDSRDGRNLTREASEQLNRLSADELKRLDSLTAFTLGKGSKTLYFVTDPQCPYCKRAEKQLEKLTSQEDLTVKFLLFPLNFHKGAKEQCISIICDKKGFSELQAGYKSDNQCDEGRKKVEETVSFLSQKGVSGTPTYIFPDGLRHAGVMQENQLREKMGLPPSTTVSKKPDAGKGKTTRAN